MGLLTKTCPSIIYWLICLFERCGDGAHNTKNTCTISAPGQHDWDDYDLVKYRLRHFVLIYGWKVSVFQLERSRYVFSTKLVVNLGSTYT